MNSLRIVMASACLAALALALLAAACGPAGAPADGSGGAGLRVVATTTIVGDVVAAVGGGEIDLTVLLPVGADPHSLQPTPRDMAAVAEAGVLFVNGLGLERFLEPLLESAGGNAAVVSVSEGIEVRRLEAGHGHGARGDVDPHVWTDPGNVAVWARNVAAALGELEPANAAAYRAAAAAYAAELAELDRWIAAQVARVPPERRKLVTDHNTLAYFAERYGFRQVGVVFPGFSALSEPSAGDLARLATAVREQGVAAVFVGTTVNPGLAERIAEDAGIAVVAVYTGSLSEAGGPADNYISLMRYNVTAIVNALE